MKPISPQKALGLLLTASLLLFLAWKIRQENSVWTALGEHSGDNFGTKVASAGDINGDGFADVAVWAANYWNYSGKIYVYLGSPHGLSKTPAWTTQGEAKNDRYGRSFGTVGDVNGDGFGDFIVAAEAFDAPSATDAGKAYLYYGSAKGLSPTPSWTRTGFAPNELFGDCSGKAGDVNRDGFGDVIIGAFGHNSGEGAAYLFHGSKNGLSDKPAWMVQGEAPNDWFGYSVASAPRANDSGYPSIVLGAKQHKKGNLPNVGKVYVYYGSREGVSKKPSWSAEGENAQDLFGWRALSAGDLYGTGFDGIIVSAYEHSGRAGNNAGKVYVYAGSAGGISAAPSWTAEGENAQDLFGYTIASGDFNGDGFSDVIVGASGYKNHTGKVYLFLGSRQGLSQTPFWTKTGEGVDNYFGAYVANAGDVNGDGIPDLVVGAHYNSEKGDKAGKAYMFYGRKNGFLSQYP